LAAAAGLLIFGIPANFLVGAVQSRFEAATGYHLRLGGETTISLRPAPTIFLRGVTLSTGSDADSENRFSAERIGVVFSLPDLLRGHPRISQVTISHPTVRLPVVRDRAALAPSTAPSAKSAGPAKEYPAVDRVVIEDGAVDFYGRFGRDEGRIDRINLDASPVADAGGVTVTGNFFVGGQMFHIDLKSGALPQGIEGQTIPVTLTLEAPEFFDQPCSARAELRLRNRMLSINTLSGKFGRSSFNGWATIDFGETKPMVKADLDFDELPIAPAPVNADPNRRNALNEPWSDRSMSFVGLNFFDAQMRLSAANFKIRSFQIAPLTLDATINSGLLQVSLLNTALYGGTANGELSLDASSEVPSHAVHVRLDGVSALPLLSDVAGFDSLEGSMQAHIDLKATGSNQKSAISSLAGAVDIHLTNGAVRGVDLAKLTHDLTHTILNGWQQNPSDKTPLSNLSARFSVVDGVATVDYLDLAGPSVRVTGTGTIDVAAKTLRLKVDPRIFMGQQAVGAAGEGTGLGVPVLIQGNWDAPRIYPDVAGIFNDSAGVFNQLKAAGKGLFGDNMGQFGNHGTNSNPGNSEPVETDSSGHSGALGNFLGGIGNMLKGPAGNSGNNR
jgi:AsmA protein